MSSARENFEEGDEETRYFEPVDPDLVDHARKLLFPNFGLRRLETLRRGISYGGCGLFGGLFCSRYALQSSSGCAFLDRLLDLWSRISRKSSMEDPVPPTSGLYFALKRSLSGRSW